MAANPVDWEDVWSQMIAKAWADAAFKQRLLADPVAVLKEHGVLTPASIQFKVLENTDKVIHLVIPVKPAPEELSEDELHRVAGGHCHRCHERCGERCGERCHERCSERCSERCRC
jgi:hypothetical protein